VAALSPLTKESGDAGEDAFLSSEPDHSFITPAHSAWAFFLCLIYLAVGGLVFLSKGFFLSI
jgi:hypothetical protein